MSEEQVTPTEVDSEALLLEEFTRQATQELLLTENVPSELKTKVVEPLTPILEPNSLVEEEAPAAGFDAVEAGHSFVDLIRIVENVPNASYGFPTNPTLPVPEIKGENLGVREDETVTSTEPEDPTPDPYTPTPEEPEEPEEPKDPEDPTDPETPVEPEEPVDPEDPVDPEGPKGNNGWGNGDQDAPGNSGPNNNAENNTSGKEDPSHGGNSNSPSILDTGNSNNSGNPKGNNGWGNGDQDAPGNSGPNNNAENNTSGKQSPLSKKDVLAEDTAELMFGGSLMPEDLAAATELITQITRHVNHP